MMRRLLSPCPHLTRAAIVAAAMLSATSAQAAINTNVAKAANGKPDWFETDTCHDAAVATASIAAPSGIPFQQLSALDRIRLRQLGSALEPAAAGSAPPVRAMAPANPPACSGSRALPGRLTRRDSFEPAAGDPDSELGTVALPVDHTRFDARWDRVRRAAPTPLMRAELRKAGVNAALDERDMLQRVNQSVNRDIAYVEDERNYGERDFWATAGETIARGRGDCEDFAILKMQMLRAAGIDTDRMKLVLLRDLALGADHAVLLVRSRDGWLALDNMTDRLYSGPQTGEMRPMLSFSGARRWIHGYADNQPAPPRVVTAAGSETERRRIENPAMTSLAGRSAKSTAAQDVATGFVLTSLTAAPTVRDMLGRRRLFEMR